MILTGRKPGVAGLPSMAREREAGGDVGVREVAATYHVPISNTAAGMMLLEPAG
jgi:hypothetical protein